MGYPDNPDCKLFTDPTIKALQDGGSDEKVADTNALWGDSLTHVGRTLEAVPPSPEDEDAWDEPTAPPMSEVSSYRGRHEKGTMLVLNSSEVDSINSADLKGAVIIGCTASSIEPTTYIGFIQKPIALGEDIDLIVAGGVHNFSNVRRIIQISSEGTSRHFKVFVGSEGDEEILTITPSEHLVASPDMAEFELVREIPEAVTKDRWLGLSTHRLTERGPIPLGSIHRKGKAVLPIMQGAPIFLWDDLKNKRTEVVLGIVREVEREGGDGYSEKYWLILENRPGEAFLLLAPKN